MSEQWRGEDSNLRSRSTADLQSAPFGHSGTPPGNCLSWRWDLNPQPADYKSAALPFELRQRNLASIDEKVIACLSAGVSGRWWQSVKSNVKSIGYIAACGSFYVDCRFIRISTMLSSYFCANLRWDLRAASWVSIADRLSRRISRVSGTFDAILPGLGPAAGRGWIHCSARTRIHGEISSAWLGPKSPLAADHGETPPGRCYPGSTFLPSDH